MTTKPAFPALGAPMSPAWVHGSPHVEDLALPKSLKSCNFTLAKAVIRWMSVESALRWLQVRFGASGEYRIRQFFMSYIPVRCVYLVETAIGQRLRQPQECGLVGTPDCVQ
jgi:hypothetical protein